MEIAREIFMNMKYHRARQPYSRLVAIAVSGMNRNRFFKKKRKSILYYICIHVWWLHTPETRTQQNDASNLLVHLSDLVVFLPLVVFETIWHFTDRKLNLMTR